MKCLFCKQPSNNSKSVEHIIPESLGNTEHILGKGIVCDKCNNYFAIKIEQPLLQLPYFVSLRHRNDIVSKKGKIPIDKGVLLGSTPTIVNFHRNKDGKSISIQDERLIEFLHDGDTIEIVIPLNEEPPKNEILVSKLLGKIGLEALAKVGEGIDGGLQEVIDKTELDAIRNYVRFGQGVKFWDYSCRRLYPEDKLFTDSKVKEKYQILHEYRLLYTDDFQLLIIVAIMGFEYCLNLANPTTKSYLKWLKQNKNISPLYNYSSLQEES